MFSWLRRLCWRWNILAVPVQRVADALCLTDVEPDEDEIGTWTNRERLEAISWAWLSHLHANDNDDVVVPPEPPHVKALPRQKWS